MLARKQQEYTVVEQENISCSGACLEKINVALRVRCLIVLSLLTLIAVFATVRSEEIVRSGYELVRLKAQATSLEKDNEALRVEIARLKSPQRIQQIAMTELGMVIPQQVYCAITATPNVVNNHTYVQNKEKSVFDHIAGFVRQAKAEASKLQ